MRKTLKILLGILMSVMLIPSTVFAVAKTKKVVLTEDNTVFMNTYYNWTSAAKMAQKAKDLDAKLPSKEPIFLVLDTGGGSIEAGLELISNLNALNRTVHTITLFSASMGFQTVQGVKGKRLILENGTLMSHKAKGMFYGEFPGQLDSRYGYYLRRVARMEQQAVKRTKGKYTLKSYRSLIENEFWCDGADCIKHGFADYLAVVKCDQSLSGTYLELWGKFFVRGVKLEIYDVKSKCPTITGMIDYKIFIDGEPLNEFKDNHYLNEELLLAIDKTIKQETKNRIDNNRKVIKGY